VLSGGRAPALGHDTLGEALGAVSGPAGVVLVDAQENERRIPWSELHSRARHVAGALIGLGVKPGDRVVIVLPTGLDFLDAFFGATLAGAVPVPLYPPIRLGRIEEYHAATARMITAVRARIVLTDERVGRLLGVAMRTAHPPLGLHHVASLVEGGHPAPIVARRGEDLALIQFSSGSTVDPKPVMLTHHNVLSQCAMVSATLPRAGDASVTGVSWLPLYHDMGLIGGLLTALYHRGTMVLLSPEDFLVQPAAWLRAISRHKAIISPAPNFAFAVATKRIKPQQIEGLDLSSWKFALCGAEPVSSAVMAAFAKRFAPFGFDDRALMPVYGLAEASLAVTFTRPDQPVRALPIDPEVLAREGTLSAGARDIVSVGRPVPGVEVMLRDPDAREVETGVVGRIFVRGPAVMAGYFDRPDATKAVLQTDGWLDTGDLGFELDGELYVTGRAKDVIVIRGGNHAPQEFEECLDDLPGVRPGCVIAVGHIPDGAEGEELLVLVERKSEGPAIDLEALSRAAREAIVTRTGVRPHHVAILEPGTLPRTSSGKLRRQEALRRYVAGALEAPRPVNGLFIAKELLRSTVAKIRLDLG